MDYIKDIDLHLPEKLKADSEYRNAFFRASATDNVALQMRGLRKLRDFSQTKLAEACQMRQSAISRIEQADYSSWTFNTLWRVAEALGARLIINFQTVEDAISEFESDPEQVTGDAAPLEKEAAATQHVGIYEGWAGDSRRSTKYRIDDPAEATNQTPLESRVTELT